jgi:hypothetical protein
VQLRDEGNCAGSTMIKTGHPDVRNDFPPLRTANASAAQHLPSVC